MSQSTFIPGTDNVIIASECIYAIQRNTDERGNFCAHKLNLSKTYDKVDCGFLNNVLSKLGFQGTSVQRLMSCVTLVCYSTRFNGVMGTMFSHLI